MPSLLGLFVSSIVFFVVAWYLRRYLLDQGIQNGFTLGIVVMTLASVASLGADKLISLAEHKPASKTTAVHLPDSSSPEIAAIEAQSAVKDTGQE
jgi:hypothetical protein